MGKKEQSKAIRHLKKDKRLALLIYRFPAPDFESGERGRDPFHALIRSIIFQQLSGKAAGTILGRFLKLFPKGEFPAPTTLLKVSSARMRSAGVSRQKASYLHDLARKFTDGTIEPKRFSSMSDEEIRAHVIAVSGIGVWTADMFLMFTLKRQDVLPTGDLGIQKAMKKLFALRTLPSPEKMKKLARSWVPYRTTACWYLWRLSDEGNPNR